VERNEGGQNRTLDGNIIIQGGRLLRDGVNTSRSEVLLDDPLFVDISSTRNNWSLADFARYYIGSKIIFDELNETNLPNNVTRKYSLEGTYSSKRET
jgi:hypothetical protein